MRTLINKLLSKMCFVSGSLRCAPCTREYVCFILFSVFTQTKQMVYIVYHFSCGVISWSIILFSEVERYRARKEISHWNTEQRCWIEAAFSWLCHFVLVFYDYVVTMVTQPLFFSLFWINKGRDRDNNSIRGKMYVCVCKKCRNFFLCSSSLLGTG